ncbi:MAG TPA: hypothetical protein VIJ33_04610 [Solirubrobacteraceae bacterium]
MTGSVIPTEIDQSVALDWLHYSLGQGEVISPAALKFIEERQGHAYTLAPETVDPARLAKPREGGVVTTGGAQAALAKVLEGLTERGAACVVVEDCLRLRRDPKPSLDGLLLTAFVGERVIHWAGLEGETDAAILTLHRGSGKYPLNAFVTSASELGLVDGADLDSDIAGSVVGSLVAVVVAAYDAETYIIWEPR